MKKISFALGIHNHQPVGNQLQVFESAYFRAYEPFIGVLEKHPSIKVTLHYSGSLIDWLLVEHPDFLKRIRRLAGKGQVEDWQIADGRSSLFGKCVLRRCT